MYTVLVKDKIFEQSEVYRALKSGVTASVQYCGYKDEKWGTKDANYLNRMRLAYYLLYAQIDDEDAIVYLFQEELKDRKSNSFQEIGNTLNVLTSILKRYNNDGRYNGMLEEAKNANFDCACGYDKNYQIDDEVDSLELLDCIFLSQDLEYTKSPPKRSIFSKFISASETVVSFHVPVFSLEMVYVIGVRE